MITQPAHDDARLGLLLTILDGLVAARLLELQRPGELERAYAEAPDRAYDIGELGDRLTAPGNFRGAREHHVRGEALNAVATALALGALQPGGITWAGRHWCTAAHANCPNAVEAA